MAAVVKKAGGHPMPIAPNEGVTELEGFGKAAKKRYWDRDPKIRTLA